MRKVFLTAFVLLLVAMLPSLYIMADFVPEGCTEGDCTCKANGTCASDTCEASQTCRKTVESGMCDCYWNP